jgi:hypothetical protein
MKILKILPRVFIFIFLFGNTTKAVDSLYVFANMTGDKVGDYFCIVKGVGDINGDGYDDVVVGAEGGNYAKLYLGGAVFDTIPDLIFNLPEGYKGSNFGWAIASGDLNGDGYPDIAIGAPHYGDFGQGKVFIYYGGSGLDTIPDKTVSYYTGFRYTLGYSMAIGDINGDGYDDLVISAPRDDIDWRGRIFVYFGGSAFSVTNFIEIEGISGSRFGISVSIAGDINNDGCKDIIVGAPGTPYGPFPVYGKAYLIFGDKNKNLDSIITFNCDISDTAEFFGVNVAGLGDINNDSYDDFGVMTWKSLNIYSGKTLEVMKRITEQTQWPEFRSLMGFDLNGDKYSDVMLGLGNDSLLYAGTLAIFLGSQVLDTIPDYINNGTKQLQYFGYSIDYAGDVNKDGYKDIIVGDRTEENNIFRNGRVHLLSLNSKIVNVEKNDKSVKDFIIFQNYPNPFNPTTTISYQLKKLSDIIIRLYDILGNEIACLKNEEENIGEYKIDFNAQKYGLCSGIYFLRFDLRFDKYSLTKISRLLFIK